MQSLWQYFFPDLLSESREFVCLKWFQGKATFFNADSFSYLVAFLNSEKRIPLLSVKAQEALEFLEDSSPHSLREIKIALGWVGPLHAKEFNQMMKELWQLGLIAAWGNGDRCAFPSTMVAASRQLFEPYWQEARKHSPSEALSLLGAMWGNENPFLKFAIKIKSQQVV